MAGNQTDLSAAADAGFLSAGGEMAARIGAFDWTAVALGPIAAWPQSLKTTVGLLLHSPLPIVLLWGTDGIMIYNDAYSVFAGGRHPRLLGSKVREGWPEVADFNDNVMRVGLSGGTLSYEDQELTLHRSGRPEPVWMNLDYSPVIGEDGNPAGVIAFVVETTKRVLMERQLAGERDRLSVMFEQGPSFMAMLRGPEHRVEFANAAYHRLVGHRELVGRTVAQALPDAVEQGYLELLDNVFKTGEAFRSERAKYAMQVSPDGPVDERYLDFVYQPVKDSAGNVTGIFVEGVDVTERKKAEDALKEAKDELELRVAERTRALQNIGTFYNHSSECHAMLALRDDGRFEYEEINPATLKLYGKTRDEVIGRTVDDLFDPDTAAALNEHLAEALQGNGPYRYLRQQTGSLIEAIATSVRAETGRPRLTVTARDITERQSLEEQLRQAQKMEAVGQLTGGLAHDFNNLLQGIIGSLDRVQHRLSQSRTGDVERFLHAAVDSAHRAAALTHRLLAFSRRQTLDPRPSDPNRLIAGMHELISRTVGPEVTVQVVGAVGLWPILVDASQLESALLNLCINARDAMPNGGNLIIETANKWMDERAARERELPAGQYVSLCVTDSGTGMTPEVIARAFDPFFTTKPLGQGTGLGLSMIYGFLRQSGGQVRIYSEIGKGTTMCLYFPRYLGSADAVEAESHASPIEHGFGESVLVVDDEPTVRMLISEVLSERSYRVVEASDGPAALKLLESPARIDLLITDVGLPGGLNGRQIADAARHRRKDLKVLFITGYAENAAVGNGHLEPGMSVLTKPFAMAVLANKVREMLEG
jgi:PAS domain S-box-containing protein